MKPLKIALLILLGIPLAYVGSFFILQFPFTSGVIAHSVTTTGDEYCVVQTYKGIEPYQVSLYARRPGQAWAWSYLAHEDDRWRECRIEVAGDEVRVFRGSVLVRALPVARATDSTGATAYNALPASYSPEQLLDHHNRAYH